jgi:hypothetical protein
LIDRQLQWDLVVICVNADNMEDKDRRIKLMLD